MALTRFAHFGLSWRDAKGLIARTSYYLHFDPTDLAFLVQSDILNTDMDAMSNAAVHSTTLAAPAAVAYGTPAIYQSAADKAVFAFSTARGDIHHISVPAPLDAIFLADDRTVDPANTDVAAFVNQVTVVMGAGNSVVQITNRTGEALIVFLGGYRVKGRESRKVDIYRRDDNLTPKEPQ